MAKRAKRRVKRRKTHHKKPRKKVTKRAKSKRSKGATKKALETNRKAQWSAYRTMQKKVDKAWAKLRADVAKRVKPQILIRDKNHLMLLLGECNYMARECMRLANKARRR